VDALAERAFARLVERIEFASGPPRLDELACAIEFRGSITAPRPGLANSQASTSQPASRARAGWNGKRSNARAKS